jgi:hypothetical protein
MVAMEVTGLKTFQAKISLKNEPSINLFKTKFAYYQASISTVFEEVVLEWTLLEPNTPAKIDEYGNEIVPYGSKATLEQHTKVLKMHKELIFYWANNVISSEYDKIYF